MAFKLQIILLAAVVAATFVEGAVVKQRKRRSDELANFPGNKCFWQRSDRFVAALVPPVGMDGSTSQYIIIATGIPGDDLVNFDFTAYAYAGAYRRVIYKDGLAGDCYLQELKESYGNVLSQVKANENKALSDTDREVISLGCMAAGSGESNDLMAAFPFMSQVCSNVGIFMCAPAAMTIDASEASVILNSLNAEVRIA